MKKKLLYTAASVLALASASHAATITWDETAADLIEIDNGTWTTGLVVTDGDFVLGGTDGVTMARGDSEAGSTYGLGKTITLGGYDFDGDGFADTVTMRYSYEAVGGTIKTGSSGHGVKDSVGGSGPTLDDNAEGFNFGTSVNPLTVVLSDSDFTVTNLSFDGFAGVQTEVVTGASYSLGTEFGDTSIETGSTVDTDFDLTTAFGLTHEAGGFYLTDVGYQFSFDVVAIPEPSTYALLAGLTGLVFVMVRRRR